MAGNASQQLQMLQQQQQQQNQQQQPPLRLPPSQSPSPYVNPHASSSSSSSERPFAAGASPSLTAEDFGHLSDYSSLTTPQQSPYSPPTANEQKQKKSDDFVGAGFHDLNHHALPGIHPIDSAKATGYQHSLRRPGPPIMSHTTPNPNMTTPTLRQSASFSTGDKPMEVTPPRTDTIPASNSKRYSDETKDSRASLLRKKSGFSQLMSSMRGSPRRINISDPVNPIHVTHVGYDNQTGQFTVR